MLNISNLHARAGNEKILGGVSLKARPGEIHAIMGPNGSGKSTLAKVIMGHPGYRVTRGTVIFKRKNLLTQEPDERAQAGVFLAFQYPLEVPGVNMFSYLRAIYSARFGKSQFNKKKTSRATVAPGAAKQRSDAGAGGVSVEEFEQVVTPVLKQLHIPANFLERSLNEGFSGGEKKKAEILQLGILKPRLIILDETDSGLDIDALKTVARGVKKFRDPDSIVLIITHYQRILKYIKPDFVHVMKAGKMVRSGGHELARELEKKGYKDI